MAGMVYWEKDETKSDDFPVLIQGDSSFLIVKNTTLLIKYVFGCLLEETGGTMHKLAKYYHVGKYPHAAYVKKLRDSTLVSQRYPTCWVYPSPTKMYWQWRSRRGPNAKIGIVLKYFSQSRSPKLPSMSHDVTWHQMSNVQNPCDMPLQWSIHRDPYDGLS